MEEQFPVNSGNIPPPSQSTNVLSHQLANFTAFQNSNGQRRKGKETQRPAPKLKLERIMGLTSTSSNILATANDVIAYAAGAVVVIYNHKRNKQVALLYPPQQQQLSNTNTNNNNVNNSNLNQPSTTPLILPLGGINANTNNDVLQNNITTDEKKSATPASTRAKPISCLAFSPDGNYLAAGEMGHQPRILIWDVKEKKLLREFKSHKFGVLSLSFSPNMRYLVSIGFQHDGYLYVWDWKKGMKLAGNKVTSKVNAVSFSKDGSYFVTAGLRHVKYWYLDARGRIPKRGNLSSSQTQVLDGRSGILGVLRDANFVDVACDRSSQTGYTYFITDLGILCIFKEGRVLDKWVDLQVKNSFSIAVSSNYVICTCSEGVIRLFEPVTLKYVGILPKPHPLGTDISLVTSPDMVRSNDAHYPDAVAMVYNATSQRVVSVYSDKSLYVWDIRDLSKIGKYRSFIFHSDCVWGVEPCPNIERDDNAIPLNSFATFSADGTVRIWNLDTPVHTTSSTSSSPLSPPVQQNGILSPSSSTVVGLHRRNIYSRELVKMIYVDPDAAQFSKLRSNFEFAEDQCPDFGIRSLKMSADGQMMASGDRSGNLRVHDMNSWEMLTYQEAHDSEILSIDLTTPTDKDAPSLIATASRDRLLHIFDIKTNFQLVQSLDDHSSSITAVKFSQDSEKLISCGADKGIIFRHLTNPVTPFLDSTPRPFSTYHNYSGRSTVFDMALDVNARYVATVTGERKLYVLSVESGKPFRICKPETADEIGKFSENSGGSLINIDLDPFSGTYAVTSGSDRCIRLFDLTNSTCIEKMCAHSELITSVKFIRTNTEEDGLRVVSTCSDGTIFIWKVNREIIAKMCARATERDLKMKQHRTEDDGDTKRAAMLLGLQSNHNKRARRVSTVTNVRPTASISQMIRQGERRTFSTMSPAEQKYDDVYKKIAASSGRRNQINENTTIPTTINNTQTSETPPGSPNRLINNNNRNVFLRKENRIISAPLQQQQDLTGRKSPPEKTGKLDRLYNGLPTSYGRERTQSQVTPPAGLAQYRQQSPTPPASAGARNPILRRAISRDAILKKDQEYNTSRKSPTKTTVFTLNNNNNNTTTATTTATNTKQSVINRRSSQPSFNRRKSDPQQTIVTSKATFKSLAEEDDSDNDADTNNNDNTREEEEKDEDDEEEEEDEYEEEEEIIFTPEQDRVCKPFEVSQHHHHHSTQTTCDEEDEEESGSAPVSDNETSTQLNCNDEESSEDNADDEINRDITAREPPRVSTSIIRTSTSSSIRRSIHIDGSGKLSHDDSMSSPIMPSSPPHESIQDTIEIAQTSVAYKEIRRKMERAAKRQSITARFLSSLTGAVKNDGVRPSLDHVMSSFQSISSQPTSLITPPISTHVIQSVEQPVKLTIDIVPPSVYHQPAVEEDNSLLKLKLVERANEPIEPVRGFIEPAKESTVPVRVPDETKAVERKKVVTDKEEEEAVEKKPVEEEVIKTEEESVVKKKEKGPINEELVEKQKVPEREEEDPKLENALADLDGVAILLDSVLETYLATAKSISNRKSLLIIENKLDQVVDKISKTIQKPDISEQSPETIKLLERYSALLLNIVETKINSK
ncbi:hypothetical protein EDC94DRAFT_627884 [Helicostylum pulchrum]|nr:hypothetical protein EDC94DRAFT_627884 [Helicostylum pulchrum]